MRDPKAPRATTAKQPKLTKQQIIANIERCTALGHARNPLMKIFYDCQLRKLRNG